jgi:ribosome-binding factor A
VRASRIREPFVLSKYKTRQLCRQVQRALNLALAERASDPGLDQLYVVDVTSDFGCGHLFVHFSVPEKRSMADVLASLERAAPRLRAQVAGAICRKRAPALTFMPAMSGGGGND